MLPEVYGSTLKADVDFPTVDYIYHQTILTD
jgi:hypothetical protein